MVNQSNHIFINLKIDKKVTDHETFVIQQKNASMKNMCFSINDFFLYERIIFHGVYSYNHVLN